MGTNINNKCKAFTSLEQSKNLAEILPLESADMEYLRLKETNATIGSVPFVKDESEVENSAYDAVYERIPCWSLAALLEEIPSTTLNNEDEDLRLHINKDDYQYYLFYENEYTGDMFEIETELYEDMIDACVEMILKLHEQKLL